MDWPTILGISSMAALVCGLVAIAELILALPMRLISKLSDWQKIREDHPARSFAVRKRIRFCTVEVNGIQYRSCATITIGEEFVTISLVFPFRAYHKPISLPISSLRFPVASCQGFLDEVFIERTETKLGLPKRITKLLNGNTRLSS